MFNPIDVCKKNRQAIQLKYPFHNECAICQETMYNKCVKFLECEHHFHLKCINKWLNKSNSCPMCRKCTNSQNKELDYSRLLAEILNELNQNHHSFLHVNDHYDFLNSLDSLDPDPVD